MSGSVNNLDSNLLNLLCRLEMRLQEEECSRLQAESKLEVYRQDLLPIIEKCILGAGYNLQHVGADYIGKISASRDFLGGLAPSRSGSESDNRRHMHTVHERRNEIGANAAPKDLAELRSAVERIQAQLETQQPDQMTRQGAGSGAFKRIAEKTGTTYFVELAKQLAGALF